MSLTTPPWTIEPLIDQTDSHVMAYAVSDAAGVYFADVHRLAAELKAACDDRDSYVRTLETVSASEDRLAAECERLREALHWIAGDGSTATIPQGVAREVLSAQPADPSPWRPIGELPEKQKARLGYWHKDPDCTYWAEAEGHWYTWLDGREWSLTSGQLYREPTHFFIVPPPPADQEGEAK